VIRIDLSGGGHHRVLDPKMKAQPALIKLRPVSASIP
jgi:hypothetical protein